MSVGWGLRGSRREEMARRVQEAARIRDSPGVLGPKRRQLSGGQRQRVPMGRPIVRDPKVFLFDEPLSNLDAKLRVSMRSEIKSLHQRLKTTTVYVTHDQIEALTMADRIVVLRDGMIEQIGTPLELYDTPENIFVAEFIGSPAMNLLPARLKRSGTRRAAMIEGGVVIELPEAFGGEEGQEVLLGIRPEHLSVGEGGTLSGRVALVEPIGRQG